MNHSLTDVSNSSRSPIARIKGAVSFKGKAIKEQLCLWLLLTAYSLVSNESVSQNKSSGQLRKI